MADGRGAITDALTAQQQAAIAEQQPSGFAGGFPTLGRGGPQQNTSPYGAGFTAFGNASRPTPSSTGFTPPPGAQGRGLFAPPPVAMSNFAPPPTQGMPPPAMPGGGGFAPPPQLAPQAASFAPPAAPTGIGTGGLFAPPPTPGAPMSSGSYPALPPRPFQSIFSPSALANPQGAPGTRGRGF